MKLDWEILIEEEDLPVRGNALVSGDVELDTKVENEIIERLGRGDTWAWAYVVVKCTVNVDGQQFNGVDYLGACSYRNEEDFKNNSGYYEDMQEEAKKDLIENLLYAVTRGKIAQQVMDNLK